MNLNLDDTIAALASAAGPGGMSLIRVSGPQTRDIIGAMFLPFDVRRWEVSERAQNHTGRIVVSSMSSSIPVSVYFWPNARSYTGQISAEIHLPGSPPLVDAVLADLFHAGARPAEGGEFTLRAFLAGKIDLVQAEAVLGVIDASSQNELCVALDQLGGGISGRFSHIRQQLLELLADLEAGLDFVDEDIEFVTRPEVQRRLTESRDELLDIERQAHNRMQSVGRPRVALAGLPNAGKSTLFNALVGTQSAIVSDEAGTTRDYLSQLITWNNSTWELIDTAGWEPVNEGIEGLAQQLRTDQWQRADLIILCEAKDHPSTDTATDRQLIDHILAFGPPVMRIRTKADLMMNRNTDTAHTSVLEVSARLGDGLDALNHAIAEKLTGNGASESFWLGSTAARCHDSLAAALDAIGHAIDATNANWGDEIVTGELRQALNHIGRIVGAVYTDDVLDQVFSRFCIGK
ncbi:MAG: 50S ribosome-binding GTPase [Planctomycetota bacterium]|nr:50S ribosome-binding GTPase [Planctomycetota bacterium]